MALVMGLLLVASGCGSSELVVGGDLGHFAALDSHGVSAQGLAGLIGDGDSGLGLSGLGGAGRGELGGDLPLGSCGSRGLLASGVGGFGSGLPDLRAYGPSLGVWLVLVGAGVKLCVVPLHVWLGKVHAEASTVGSVLLAGVGLKLGWVLVSGVGLPSVGLGLDASGDLATGGLANGFTVGSLGWSCGPARSGLPGGSSCGE